MVYLYKEFIKLSSMKKLFLQLTFDEFLVLCNNLKCESETFCFHYNLDEVLSTLNIDYIVFHIGYRFDSEKVNLITLCFKLHHIENYNVESLSVDFYLYKVFFENDYPLELCQN